MKEFSISIGELYNKLIKNGNIEQFYNIQKDSIYIQDENSEFIEVTSIIKKTDSIREIMLSNGEISKTALNHLYFDGEKIINAKDLKLGSKIQTVNGLKEILKIEDTEIIEDVFDISVKSDSHLFQTANGIIHHNTSVMHTVAKDENMGLICIDVSNLSPEDFTGMPIADQSGDEITTKFSEPSLYNFIMKQYNEQISEVKQEGRPYNVILLFDEISRTTTAVFNSMRKVLLEKEFSPEYPLPTDVLVTGALNPSGEGTNELTKHSTDVLNIIQATAKFSEVIKYAVSREAVTKINTILGFDASGVVGNIITSLAREFESKERPDTDEKLNLEEAPFWWTVNGETFYISGREFTEAIANILGQMEDRLLDMGWDKDANYEDTDYENFMQEALNVTANGLGHTLNMVVTKMKVQNFVPTLIGKIINNPKFKGSFSPMKERKTSDELPLDELYKLAGGTPDVISKRMIGNYLRYTSSPTQFGQDFARLITKLIEEMDMNKVSLVIIGIAEKTNQIFVELEYPEAVSNAFNDVMLKQTKQAIRSMFENPNIDFFDSEELIDAILRVF